MNWFYRQGIDEEYIPRLRNPLLCSSISIVRNHVLQQWSWAYFTNMKKQSNLLISPSIPTYHTYTPHVHTTFAHPTCTHLHITPAHHTCTLYLHTTPIHHTCTPHLHTTHTYHTCTHLHTTPTHHTCTPHLHTTPAHICTPHLHTIPTYHTCTPYLHTTSAHTCTLHIHTTPVHHTCTPYPHTTSAHHTCIYAHEQVHYFELNFFEVRKFPLVREWVSSRTAAAESSEREESCILYMVGGCHGPRKSPCRCPLGHLWQQCALWDDETMGAVTALTTAPCYFRWLFTTLLQCLDQPMASSEDVFPETATELGFDIGLSIRKITEQEGKDSLWPMHASALGNIMWNGFPFPLNTFASSWESTCRCLIWALPGISRTQAACLIHCQAAHSPGSPHTPPWSHSPRHTSSEWCVGGGLPHG